MNILLINHYAGSPEMGMEFRPYYMAREWTKMGHRVRIIAGDYSHLRIKNPSVKKDFQKELIDGIEYRWLKTGDYEGNGVRRALTMFRFVWKLWINAKRIAHVWKPDVVIASSTYPLDTYAAQRIARIAGAKLIHEVHDMWPSTLYELGGMSRHNPFVILMQIAENSAYRNSDNIVSLLSLAKPYMEKHGMVSEKFVHIPNGVVEDDWSIVQELPVEHHHLLDSLKKGKKFIVGYFGGHALSNALDSLLDVAKATPNPDIVYVLVGDGVEKKTLQKRSVAEHLNNVYFLPPVSKKAIPSLVSWFDCVYVGAKPSPLYRFGICLNKIFDSMMAGKPIICAISTPDPLIRQYDCGKMVIPGDIPQIINSINEFYEMSEDERIQIGKNGKKAVLQHYTYNKLAIQFEALFN